MKDIALPAGRRRPGRALGAAVAASIALVIGLAAGPAQAATTPAYISMEDGLDPSILGPDPCSAVMHLLGQCTYTHLDPAYAPPLAIDREPSTTTPTAPADGAPCGGMTPLKADGTPWTCTFSDEFSGSRLDPDTWSQQLTADGSRASKGNPLEACFTGSPDNVAVEGGELRLTVRDEGTGLPCARGARNAPYTTRFTGGGIDTRSSFAQAYGRFEVRAAFPATTKPGLQSSLWLWPRDSFYGPWPASGEIDIAEYYTDRPGFVVPTLHYRANSQKDTTKGINSTQDALCHFDTPERFHDYTVEWSPDVISIYYDGTLCLFDHWRPWLIGAPSPFDKPFYPALTAALGVPGTSDAYAAGTTELPATTKIDWIRVWS